MTRLCNARSIVTANGQYPGPTVEVSEGDSLVVNVVNNATYNITIHWYANSLYTSMHGLVISRAMAAELSSANNNGVSAGMVFDRCGRGGRTGRSS